MPKLPEFQLIDYFGGPMDGEVGAMSDGVRLIKDGGFYQAEWLKGNRRLVWHEVQQAPGTPED